MFNHSRMFKTETEYVVDSVRQILKEGTPTYLIQKNDFLEVSIYTNGGERLVDPNNEMMINQNNYQNRVERPKYLVRQDGKVRLPMIGEISLLGKTLREADSLLSLQYSKFYEEPFVITKFGNKRVIVLGPQGGKVIPLENQKLNLVEVIALYGGILENGKAFNIRHIRGDLKNPDVTIVDLSTIEGMKKANLQVEPNDIVYIEPVRRVLSESAREIAPIISVLGTLITLVVLITTVK